MGGDDRRPDRDVGRRTAEANARNREEWAKIKTREEWEKFRDQRIDNLRRSLGVQFRTFDSEGIRQIEPNLAPIFEHGTMFDDSWFLTDPRGFLQALHGSMTTGGLAPGTQILRPSTTAIAQSLSARPSAIKSGRGPQQPRRGLSSPAARGRGV